MKRSLATLATVAACLATGVAAQAVTVTFQQGVSSYAGHQDAMVRPDGANATTVSNTSANSSGYVSSVPTTLRAIQTWDLSDIPVGAIITSVTFTIGNRSDTGSGLNDSNDVIDANDPLYELRTISESFSETTATWNNTFGASMTLGATQLSTARFDPEITAAMLYNTFGSTAAFVAAVQAAVDDPSNDFNFVLMLTNDMNTSPAGQYNGMRIVPQFGSNSGNLAGSNPTVPDRPILTISYEVPEPASLGLLTLGGALVLVRRRQGD